MSEWLDNQKKPSSNVSMLLQGRIEKANPRPKLTAEETKRLMKLEGIAGKLKRGENVQNRQLHTWLSEEEYEQLEYEWQEQLELRNELKDKPSYLKRYEEKLKQATFNYNRAEDAYISPNLYPTKQQTHRHVPTWNYQVVHLHGRVQFDHSEKTKRAAVGQLTKQQERRHNGEKEWKMSDAPHDYMTAMLDNIVALSFSIQRCEAKNKISQNRGAVDFDAVKEAMATTGKTHLAKAMTKVQKK